MRKLLIPFSLTFLILQAQPANQFALTIDNIMRGSGLVGFEPSQVRWSGDSQQIYFQWKQASDKEEAPMDTYVAGRDGAAPRKLSDEETKSAPPVFGDTTRDKRLVTYTRDGDLFIYDNSTGKTQQLTKTTDAEVNPRFLADGKRIAFTRANNLYVMSVDNGMLVQLTDVRAAAPAAPAAAPATAAGFGGGGRGGRGGGAAPAVAGETPRGTDSQEYLKKEQKELLETIRERAARREEAEAKRKKDNPRKPFTLQPRQNVTSLQLSPDEKYVVATVVEGAGTAKNTIVPNYVTESAYTEDIPGRSNVGDTQGRARLALIDVASGDVKWVDHGQRTTPPDASSQRMGTEREGAAPTVRTPTPQERDVQLGQPVWSEDGTKAVMMARAADNKDRWLLALDPATGKTRVLNTDHDNAWVGGPGSQTLGWMKNDREIYFQSERTGYSHLYAVAFDGGEPRALTSGNWEVLNVRQSKDKSHFYLTASKDSPYEQHLYEMSGDGGALTRLTAAPGKHAAVLSPDERWIADVYSYTNKPPELYVQENRVQAESKKLTSSPAPDFAQYPWLDVPIVTFTARDGVKVPARLFKPANARRGGPGVVFVHGSGYLQNVDRKWSTYFHEYMFHHILRERGFTVIDVDYRGSAGYGRDWRTAVYEHMGGKDLDDIVDAAKYLAAEQGVDPKKIGLYGGSYGGFITLMAMFTQPDVFAAGAALRPVSDWALYNHGYTSDILNTPQSDPDAYRKSSPIFFAQGLKGALLICHGMVDTNVEFQDTVRLVQKLIELRKENWSLAVYPVENHGFVEPTSWADEYKRILALFEKNLKS
ncbi:MAG TPA: alpha/beta fold hydrolase [Bryobacteraceae bacterium]|nr:alpha/beta fold hydrolase [Bryobacteraceae bacterium]